MERVQFQQEQVCLGDSPGEKFTCDADSFLQMILELKDLVDKNIFTKVSPRLMLQYIRGTRDT